MYKESFGMASARAVKMRTNLRSGTPPASTGPGPPCSRRASRRRAMYLDPERPSVEDLIDSIVAGVRSSCTYAGAQNLEQFHEFAVVGVQSPTGYEEGRPLHTNW